MCSEQLSEITVLTKVLIYLLCQPLGLVGKMSG